MIGPTRQQGVALISMLLIFSLVVILVSGSVSRSAYDIRKTSYQLLNSQAYQYALGGEALARQILHDDWRNDRELGQGDHLQEAWHQELWFEPDGGAMHIRIRDLNALYNLNNLVNSDGQPEPAEVRIFQRLTSQLGLTQQHIAACLDWLDKDTQPQTAYSEDVHFLSQENGYRSADGPINHLSELKALNQFSDKELERLENVSAALPQGTSINPNTAPELLLNSLAPQIDGARIIAAREQMPQGFTSTEAFLQHEVTAGIDLNNVNLDVHSDHFLVSVSARYQDHTSYLTSVLYRDPSTGSITTLNRHRLRPSGKNSTTATRATRHE